MDKPIPVESETKPAMDTTFVKSNSEFSKLKMLIVLSR